HQIHLRTLDYGGGRTRGWRSERAQGHDVRRTRRCSRGHLPAKAISGRPSADSDVHRAAGTGLVAPPDNRTSVTVLSVAVVFAIKRSTVIYPTVVATTSNAPSNFGGLGTGISKNRHKAPKANPRSKPIKLFI